MGVISGLIATNSKELAELRQLGERNYFEFDIKKTDIAQKIGGIRLTLAKSHSEEEPVHPRCDGRRQDHREARPDH